MRNSVRKGCGSRATWTRTALSLVLAGSLLSLGCDTPMTPRETREVNAKKDMELHPARNIAFTAPLDKQDVLEFALKYNLENRLKEREIDIQREMRTSAFLNMLPSLKADFQRSERSNPSASRSVGLETGEESLTMSSSADLVSKTYGINALFNVIDFGVGYFQARQATNKGMIMEWQLKRMRQNLALDVTRAYWKCVMAEKAAEEAENLLSAVSEEIKRIKHLKDSKIMSEQMALSQIADLTSTAQNLEGFESQWKKSKVELAKLMGLLPGARFEVVSEQIPVIEDFAKFDVAALNEEALMNRPELFQSDLQEENQQHQMRISLLRMLPSPSMYLNHDWDEDSHRYSNYWYTTGFSCSYDLLDLPSKIFEHKAAGLTAEMLQEKRVAMALGIITQLHLSVLQYHEAAENCVLKGEVSRLYDEILANVKEDVKKGGLANRDQLKASIDAFIARIHYMSVYADLMTYSEQISNVIGRDPQVEGRALPMKMVTAMDPVGACEGPKQVWKYEELGIVRRNAPKETPGKYGVKSKSFQEMAEVKAERQAEVDARRYIASLSIEKTARELNNGSFEIASAAKNRLAGEGTAGANAALGVLTSSSTTKERPKILAIMAIRRAGGKDYAAKLLPYLEDEYPRVRYQASLALRDAYNQDFGYDYRGSAKDRKDAVRRWKEFLSGNA